jgi:hypothetical protein
MNNLEEVEVIEHISSVVVANRALFKLRRDALYPLMGRLREAAEHTGG